jgi:hypothetical protein
LRTLRSLNNLLSFQVKKAERQQKLSIETAFKQEHKDTKMKFSLLAAVTGLILADQAMAIFAPHIQKLEQDFLINESGCYMAMHMDMPPPATQVNILAIKSS